MNPGTDRLQILHLEDNPADAALTRAMLKSAGIDCELVWVRSREEYEAALDSGPFDLVFSDYSLPSFDGMSALKMLLQKSPETPFIFLSGMMGEDAAIEGLLSGATDYVLKEKTARFIPAVKRAIAESAAKKNQKRVDLEIKKSMDLRAEFTAMVSHELRTPLTVIKEGVDIVLDGTDGPLNDEQKKHLKLAIKNVDRMARLINNVLTYQKLESDNTEFLMRSHDINEIVRDVAEGFLPLFKKKGIVMQVQLAQGLPFLWCDRDRITEVMTNLLNNALKFCERGHVLVKTERDGQWIQVSVADDGIGIREEDQKKLFQSFSQLGDENNRHSGGTGLGLAISKRILEKHRGQLCVKSLYGKGATFYFTLPVINAGSSSSNKRILVADDENDIMDLIGTRLSSAGYEVVSAMDGQQAMDILGKIRPRLVLLDYKMPFLNGHEVCKKMKADQMLKDIPVIFVTASPQAASPDIMRSIGADDYLVKPFQAPELFEKISRFLE